MSKKHFQSFADTVSKITDPVERRMVAEDLAQVLASVNSRFNWSQFMQACGALS